MFKFFLFLLLIYFLNCVQSIANSEQSDHSTNTIISTNSTKKPLPTLYEYYVNGHIKEGLKSTAPYFRLNKRKICIYSGSLHYFRIPRDYWRDRLKKLRATGLNTVATFIPWNLHEPYPGKFHFGNESSDMDYFLDLAYFLQVAQEEDLFVIVRLGPYICADFEFGGFPSWLINKKITNFRTSDAAFMFYVQRYFQVLTSKLRDYQFTKGGPIIMFQISHEYGSTKRLEEFDLSYLKLLKELLIKNGIVELLAMCDLVEFLPPEIDNVLQTINFMNNPISNLKHLEASRPNSSLMVMEFRTGWFNHWGESHYTRSDWQFRKNLWKTFTYSASFNLHMFHGGTNFGFLNGANINFQQEFITGQDYQTTYKPITSSYDYDALLTERGDYTRKYKILRDILKERKKIPIKLPRLPFSTKTHAYKDVKVTQKIDLDSLIEQVIDKCRSMTVTNMESLPINYKSGQQYGYIVYRKMNLYIPPNSALTIDGYVYDTIMVLINGDLVSPALDTKESLNRFGGWRLKGGTLDLPSHGYRRATLDLVVENMGRISYGNINKFQVKKGLWEGPVHLNNKTLKLWSIIPLEFRQNWINSLTWKSKIYANARDEWNERPALYKGILEIKENETLADTFINMKNWKKGFVVVNGFNLGRYWTIGPQQTLYLPGPFLQKGLNEIVVFEHYTENDFITFSLNSSFHLIKI